MSLSLDKERLHIRELLAITLREKADSYVLSELLTRYSHPAELYHATEHELQHIKGIGPIKARQIKAVVELGRCLLRLKNGERAVIKCPADVADLLMADMKYLDREVFKVIFLNTKNHVLAIEDVSVGTLNSSLIHPRECFKSAIRRSAGAILAVHNHPSGDPEPSREDIEVTRKLVEVGQLIGIELLDHVIIGDGSYVSLKERGVI